MSKYLLARTDNLGDVLFAFPTAMMIKKAEPSARIFMLVRGYAQALVTASSHALFVP